MKSAVVQLARMHAQRAAATGRNSQLPTVGRFRQELHRHRARSAVRAADCRRRHRLAAAACWSPKPVTSHSTR